MVDLSCWTYIYVWGFCLVERVVLQTNIGAWIHVMGYEILDL